MKHFNTMGTLTALIATALLTGCGSGGLPSNLEQTSTVAPLDTTPQYQQLVLFSTKTVFTQGDTQQLSASGGLPPYTYSPTNLVSATGLFTASQLGSYNLTVTDARNISAILSVTVNAIQQTTTDNTNTTTQPPAFVMPASQSVFRFFNTIHGLHEVHLVNSISGPGWTQEGEQYRTFVAGGTGLAPLYQCQFGFAMAKFETQDPNCEGQAMVGQVGFVFTSQQPGTVPLYRFARAYYMQYWGALTDHMDLKVNSAPDGWTLDGIIGFVPQ